MKLTVEKELKNNTYFVEISTSDFTEADTDLFHDFGEPSIDIGLEILSEVEPDEFGNTPEPEVLLNVPSSQRRVKSQFPISLRFDNQEYAETWISAIEQRMVNAMNDLRMKLDDFTGSQEVMI